MYIMIIENRSLQMMDIDFLDICLKIKLKLKKRKSITFKNNEMLVI